MPVLLFVPGADNSKAGIAPLLPKELLELEDWCGENDCDSAFRSVILQELEEKERIFADPIERFERKERLKCQSDRPVGPTYQALLVGLSYEHPKLKGPPNDIKLLTAMLAERGMPRQLIRAETADTISRERLIDLMYQTLACVDEGDQVFFAFSGLGTAFPSDIPGIEGLFAELCAVKSSALIVDLCFASKAEQPEEHYERFKEEYERFSRAVLDAGQDRKLFLLTSKVQEDIWTDRARRAAPGLRSIELWNFVAQVRNRGADAIVLIDTCHAGAAALTNYVQPSIWRMSLQPGSSAAVAPSGRGAVRVHGRGQMAAFYAVTAANQAIERPMPGVGTVGEFTYVFSEAARKSRSPNIKELSETLGEIYREIAAKNRFPPPIIEATASDMMFMPVAAQIEPREEYIEIISPRLTRGFSPLASDPALRLVGRYNGPGSPFKAIINNLPVIIDSTGQFTSEIDTGSGAAQIDIRVVAHDWSTLALRRINLGGIEQVFSQSPGRQYALIIANKDYSGKAWNELSTPREDASEITRQLVQRYGFSTELPIENGDKISLVVENATRGQIMEKLKHLRRRLVEDDKLLVFYAGHGALDPHDNSAYWVPVNVTEADDYGEMIEAAQLTQELNRLKAKSILVISDSCYSGALRNNNPGPESVGSEARERWLSKATLFKARQLIASGGNEPVPDNGGGGHSTFARALIEALNEMPGPVFTASELLEQKIKARVTAIPNPSGPQVPGFYRLAGDEPASEFVFIRKAQP